VTRRDGTTMELRVPPGVVKIVRSQKFHGGEYRNRVSVGFTVAIHRHFLRHYVPMV
jgi:hypothetical protein